MHSSIDCSVVTVVVVERSLTWESWYGRVGILGKLRSNACRHACTALYTSRPRGMGRNTSLYKGNLQAILLQTMWCQLSFQHCWVLQQTAVINDHRAAPMMSLCNRPSGWIAAGGLGARPPILTADTPTYHKSRGVGAFVLAPASFENCQCTQVVN